jgi:hypothetical protein
MMLPDIDCPRCHHAMTQHYVGEGWGPPEYKCWEREHPYENGRCGCRYQPPDHLLKD